MFRAMLLVHCRGWSSYGVGACLSHKVTINNKTRLLPIAYASASLKDAQKNYAQVDREGLAVYWGINHFRQYLLCQDFELHTDCSALVKIFGPKNDLVVVQLVGFPDGPQA